MAERVFAGALLALALAYGYGAFAVIRAPFQYDPLGPESWPRILSVAASLCLAVLLWRPDPDSANQFARRPMLRLGAVVLLLAAYAALYEPLGFVLSTFAFALPVCRMLGAGWKGAAVFAALAGVLGYGICAGLLGLNLPAGPLPRI